MKTITNSNQWMQNATAALLNPIAALLNRIAALNPMPALALIPALTLTLALATACTNQELPGANDPGATTPGEGRNVTITATLDSDGQPQTRLGHETDPNGNDTPGVIVKWSVGDAFKLYPAEGTASEYEIKAATDIKGEGKTASFTGSLADGASGEANALYPAAAALDEKGAAAATWADIVLTMDGQKQTGNDNYAHLSTYDYMTASVADVTSLPAGNDLSFHHRAAMMTLKITGVPDGYTVTTDGDGNAPELLTLTAGKATDGKYGTFRKTIKADGSDSNSSSSDVLTSSINLMLDGITWSADGFTAHLMMLPTDLSGKTFTVSVRCKDGTTYRYTTPQIGKAYVQGMRYTATIDGGGDWKKATDAAQAKVFNNDTRVATHFTSGMGTQTEPYLISTAAQLKYLQERTNSKSSFSYNKYYRLATDINVEDGTNWIPIGKTNYEFLGHFDGDGHTIYGTLTNSSNASDYNIFGFFGSIKDGSVRNLHIAATVTNAYAGASDVSTGGLAGNIYQSEISGCSSKGDIQGGTTTENYSGYYTGGLIGYATSSVISDCTVRGTVKAGKMSADVGGANYTGGVVGYIDIMGSQPTSTIQSCTNYATITGSSSGKSGNSYTGGIAGYTFGQSDKKANIRHCTNHGTITATYTYNQKYCYVGGLIGRMESDTNLSDSENRGDVTGGQTNDKESSCGGLAGYTTLGATITCCTNRGAVTGNSGSTNTYNYTGGLVGNNLGTLHLCLNAGTATVTKGTASSRNYAGGLVGLNGGAVYDCCTNAAKVDGADASDDNRIGGGYQDAYKNVTSCDQEHTSGGGNE